MGSRIFLSLLSVAAALTAAPFAHAATGRDDTTWLQAKLDAGGNVFLPKLPNGQCYATRGLWVSRDDTTITSDGACLVALGPGEARFKNGEGKPIHATSVFHLDHSNLFKPPPVRVTIGNLEIRVPKATHMVGIGIFGHETTLDHVTVDGSPKDDVLVGSGRTALATMSERITIRDCILAGGQRDVLSVYGPMSVLIDGNTITGARGRSAAGIHIRAADRAQPALDVHVTNNVVTSNAGPGIFLDVNPRDGAAILADGIEVTGNRVLGNARNAAAPNRAGVLLAGGQDDGKGTLLLADNVVRFNRGPGVRGRHFRFALTARSNDLSGNRGGSTRGLSAAARPAAGAKASWTPPPSVLAAAGHDDTAWLQARLDAGSGTTFLPKLPDGRCYATRGLWVSHDDTTITSDGACITSLGPGPVRLHSIDGDPIAANGVFFVNRSSPASPTPVRVSISNLRITVPAGGDEMYGVAVFGHHVTLSGLNVSGSPKDDVLIGARANGSGYVGRVAVLDSTLTGAMRNAISAFGVIDLRVEGNTISGVRDAPPGQPAAGIDVEPDDRAQPTIGMRILDNTISDNAGPGILLALDSNAGPDLLATDLVISGNTVLRNGAKRSPPTRAGIAITGGQDGGQGTLDLTNNVIRDNGGPGILERDVHLVVRASGNQVSGNQDV